MAPALLPELFEKELIQGKEHQGASLVHYPECL
jgi:hypothetical protein